MIRIAVLLIIFLCRPGASGQNVFNSLDEARKHPEVSPRDYTFKDWQAPHYEVKGFDRSFLDSDFFALEDHRKAAQVLFEKINLYRKYMGKAALEWNETAYRETYGYVKTLSEKCTLTHSLNGTNPTERMQPHFEKRIAVCENLQHSGGTIISESVDDYTDFVLQVWINSRLHNNALLVSDKYGGCAAFNVYRIPGKQEHYTVAGFSLLMARL